MKLPIALSTYNRDYGFLPYLPLRNLIVEKTRGDDEGVVLLPRPGLEVYRTGLGSTDVKGVWIEPGAFNGDDFALAGSSLYRAGVIVSSLGFVGALSARAAFSGLEMILCNAGHLYRYDGVSLTQPVLPNNAAIVSVAFLDNYFLAAQQGTGTMYWSAINDASTWPALNFASAESHPDALLDIIALNDHLAMCGQDSIEFWEPNPTGDQTLPFTRIDGLTYKKGIYNTGAAIYADNTLVWVGSDGVVYRRGAVPQRISDNSIEAQILQSSAAYLSQFLWEGHSFLMIRLDTQTLLYDFQTELFSEAATSGFPGWRAQVAATNGSLSLFGDAGSPSILRLNDTTLYDVNTTIERRFSCLMPSDGIIDNLWLDAQGGVGTEPTPVIQGPLSYVTQWVVTLPTPLPWFTAADYPNMGASNLTMTFNAHTVDVNGNPTTVFNVPVTFNTHDCANDWLYVSFANVFGYLPTSFAFDPVSIAYRYSSANNTITIRTWFGLDGSGNPTIPFSFKVMGRADSVSAFSPLAFTMTQADNGAAPVTLAISSDPGRAANVIINGVSYCSHTINFVGNSNPTYAVEYVGYVESPCPMWAAGSPVLIEVRESKDGGQTFGPWLQSQLGKRGEYRKRAVWRRMGRFDWPGGVLEFRTTDPSPFTLQSVRANEPLAGRGS